MLTSYFEVMQRSPNDRDLKYEDIQDRYSIGMMSHVYGLTGNEEQEHLEEWYLWAQASEICTTCVSS